MADFKNNDRMNEMRRRLYSREEATNQAERHDLTDSKVDVSRNWDTPSKIDGDKPKPQTTPINTKPDVVQVAQPSSPITTAPPSPSEPEPLVVPEQKKKRHYRSFVLIGSLLIFIFVVGFSSLLLHFGFNQISTENITLSVSGPPLIGGGEVLALQVAVNNQNSVPIESATLIMKYPEGSRSVNEDGRNLYEERIPISDIAEGEVRQVPVRVAVFGEENAEKTINASIEYRIAGSNGTYRVDAAPFFFRISSSPLVLSIDSIEKVASGQLVDLTIVAKSNASTPINNLLVSADYPNGFDYESSIPSPIYGQNVWKIDQLSPEESYEIKIKGVVIGLTDETFRINFNAGPAETNNQFIVGSELARAHIDYTIERPFIDVEVTINGKDDDLVTIPSGDQSAVRVNITNTLDEPVYDMVVEVVPGGNALDEDSIKSSSGFYDSNTGTVRWEVANNADFVEVQPGARRALDFTISQGQTVTTASFDIVVNVYARRVAERSAVEQLVGTVKKEAKYSSNIFVGGQLGHNNGIFTDTGPIPPTVGELTTYTLTLVTEAGANDVENVVVNTSLPVYVNWLDRYQGDGSIIYNNVSKQMEWRVGNIDGGQRKEISMQVSVLPSISQLGTTPVLLNGQQMRANDKFTGALLQTSATAINTELSTEAGFPRDNGKVIDN